MKRVLMVAGNVGVGGLETMLINFVRHGDRDNIQFDFMLNYDKLGIYAEEIRKYGGEIYIMPRLKPQNVIKYPLSVWKFFKEHKGEYDIVHGNLTSVGIIYLPIAKFFGVPVRIIHAHYTSTEKNHYEKLERFMLFPLRFCADWYFACSDKAGAFCYGKKKLSKNNYRLIRNGVDCEKFEYNKHIRSEMRQELKINEDEFVLLNVGRLEEQKNQRLLIKIMSKLNNKSVRLLIAGEGSLRNELEELIDKLGLRAKVTLLGVRHDIEKIMQAADAFILTSIFEGLPVTGIEAQAAGLPCVLADTITTEMDITGRCEFVSIYKGEEPWIKAIEKVMEYPRESTAELMKKAGYNIKEEARELSRFYLKALDEKENRSRN